MRTSILFILLLTAFPSWACEHLPYGTPKKSSLVDCREGYAIGYNYGLKSADWVSYVLKVQTTETVERRSYNRSDESIPLAFRTYERDYEEPVYDMGHLGSSRSLRTSEEKGREAALMSNIVPQLPGFNMSIWKGLEIRERRWANKLNSIYIVTGPIYRATVEYIGDGVPVPTMFFKIIYHEPSKRVLAYLIPHQALEAEDLDKYLTSVNVIETVTGLDFFDILPDANEEMLERKVAKRQWED